MFSYKDKLPKKMLIKKLFDKTDPKSFDEPR